MKQNVKRDDACYSAPSIMGDRTRAISISNSQIGRADDILYDFSVRLRRHMGFIGQNVVPVCRNAEKFSVHAADVSGSV